MMALDFKASAFANQTTEGVKRTGAASNVRSHCGAGNAQLGKWTKAKNETWTKHYVDGIRQPQHPHGYSGVTCAAKDGIDHEQHYDGGVAGEHYPGKACAMFDH